MSRVPLRAARAVVAAMLILFVEIVVIALMNFGGVAGPGVLIMSFVLLTFAATIYRFRSLSRFNALWRILSLQFAAMIISALLEATAENLIVQRIGQAALTICLLMASIFIYVRRANDEAPKPAR